MANLKGQLVMPTVKKPEDPRPKLDFEDIKAALDKELETQICCTDDKEKRKELKKILRDK